MATDRKDWVIVTGGNGSLGRGAVDRFLGRERQVLSLDQLHDEPPRHASDRLVQRPVDLASAASVDAVLLEAIPRTDRIALLVNAVGQIVNEPILALRGAVLQPHSEERWRATIEANLTAPFIIASRVAARMARTGGGAIINFSSIVASGNPGQVAYGAAKAGVEGLTVAMARELGPFGIRVNAVAPGFIDVPSTRAALDEERLATLAGATPLRRLGQLDEILDAIDFLADNAFVSGVVLDVNGGLRL